MIITSVAALRRNAMTAPVPIFDRWNIAKFDDNHPIGSPIPLQYFV
jgi:hypothetical protein